MKRKDKTGRLKDLIQRAGLDKPASDFTSIVMKEIMTEEEAAINPALQSLLKRSGTETLPVDFTQRVIMQIEAYEFKTAQPIISRKVWYISAVAVLLLVIYIGLSGQTSTDPGGLSTYVGIIGNSLASFFTTVSSIPTLYTILFISVGALVLLDYFLPGQQSQRPTN